MCCNPNRQVKLLKIASHDLQIPIAYWEKLLTCWNIPYSTSPHAHKHWPGGKPCRGHGIGVNNLTSITYFFPQPLHGASMSINYRAETVHCIGYTFYTCCFEVSILSSSLGVREKVVFPLSTLFFPFFLPLHDHLSLSPSQFRIICSPIAVPSFRVQWWVHFFLLQGEFVGP